MSIIRRFNPLNKAKRMTATVNYNSLFWFDNELIYYCHVRVQPSNEELVLFLAFFAKADARMPSLGEFAIWAPVGFEYLDALHEYDDFNHEAVSRYAGP